MLLKQTVMIRRLKEHVLVQLPPKRRQIIRLLLKRSDIVSAKAAADVGNSDAPEKNIIEDSPLEFFDEPDGSVGCLGSSIKLTYQELGIAKLTGFHEWLSLHPIVAELDGAANLDRNPSSQKMIIFAHHHKVLSGVQEFICERGIGFVRIDGNSLPRDRQLAVLSFQSSAEVKIAVVGIEAGGVGLDFSAAQNVVFLELPKTLSWMLQDTLDESHWQNMNKGLHLVSCTTDGKADVVSDLPVEKACVSMGELEGSAFEVKIGSHGRVSSFRLDEGSKEKGQEINPGTTK